MADELTDRPIRPSPRLAVVRSFALSFRRRAPPLAFADHFAQVCGQANLEGAHLYTRVPRHQLDGVIQVIGTSAWHGGKRGERERGVEILRRAPGKFLYFDDIIDARKSKQTPSEGRMEAELVRTRLTAANETGEAIPVGEIVTIGRGSSNSIVLDDVQVSRNHALIRQESGGYLIIDLGSSNGTFVNEKPATTATLLRANDVIRVGESEFVFRYVEEKGGGRGHATKRTTKRHFVALANLAILVSDIRNYTILSEALPADALSALLADWFRRVGRCVEARNGSIEKFRGDSVMAYWVPAADDDSGHIAGALRAAGDMLTASAEYEKRLSTQYPGYTFAIGCAVHCGEAVLGNIGADSRRDFTTLGDCVNVTFRMESLCGELGRPVLVSEEIKAQAEPEFAFDDLGQRTLKGKSKPMRLYALRPPEL